MACHWRIRHKLLFGLSLVVGLIGLLLAGTLYGLVRYRNSMKSIESKVMELNAAEHLKDEIKELKPLDSAETMKESIADIRKALGDYEQRLHDTLIRNREPDRQAFQEQALVEVLKKTLIRLEAAIDKARGPTVILVGPSSKEQKEVEDQINCLVVSSNDLLDEIYRDLRNSSKHTGETFKTSLWIEFTVTAVGVVLMFAFLRFFYRWVFNPIRDLELGAGRLAQGDFEHRIEVHSGDEMEDLADAFNDMTRRLSEIYHDLEHQVNERSRQLVRSERLVSVGFLAAGVAHEINNPLASIAFCGEAMESRLGAVLSGQAAKNVKDEDRDVVSKYLKMIQEEAFRCKAITERLLEFSRSGEKRREPTDLAELVQGVLDVVQHLQNRKGKTIVFAPTVRLVAAINAQEIKSVVLNLVVNALDSMDDGGTLTITLRQRDQKAELVFADTGCGMTADVLENIFEPFFTRSRTGKGTGLGLSISHRVISQHGGEIEAVSPGLNQGSTFTVRVPLQPAEPVKEEMVNHAA